MKKIVCLFFVFQLFYAQNAEERKKIVASYDQVKLNQLNQKFIQEHKVKEELIRNYKKNHRTTDFSKFSLQRVYNGTPIFYTTENDESIVTIRANSLQPSGDLGLNLTGAGLLAGVWDGGKVRETHQELSGTKIEFGDGATSFSAHSTHVTGTICAKGFVPRARGFAYQAKAKTYFWDNDLSEMTSFGFEGYLVSNHSYGYGINASFPVARFGYYDQSSADFDNIAAVLPYYQIVVAAGNSRNNSLPQVFAKGGFDMLTGSTVAKNTLVVAAVNSVLSYTGPSSVTMSSFSNYGPTDDGRIKPDIAAKGVNVYSCNFLTDATYETLSGTSMAAPAITGLIVLLQQHYNNLNSVFMKAATVRGLLCYTADEAGSSNGPDYEYGWGLANGKEAAKLISTAGKTSLLLETTLTDKVVFTKQVSIATARSLGIAIAWTDPAAAVAALVEDNRTSNLVNNLDLKIIDEAGTIYYPWKLDPTSLNNPATQNSDNNVDNIEKVFIENAPAGKYTIQVTNKGSLQAGSQDFTLIANGLDDMSLSTLDFDESDVVKLYPNPAKDYISYNLPLNFNLKQVTIYDTLGKVIKQLDNSTSNEINISELERGLYFIDFKGVKNSVTKKFIKE
jgi:subtilisin family serine protease